MSSIFIKSFLQTIFENVKTMCYFQQLWRYWLAGTVTLTTGCLGVVGNLLSLLVLQRGWDLIKKWWLKDSLDFFRELRNVFNHLLSFLCMADLVFLFSNLVLVPQALGYNWIFLTLLQPFIESCCHISLSASILITVAITVERYEAVCRPINYLTR